MLHSRPYDEGISAVTSPAGGRRCAYEIKQHGDVNVSYDGCSRDSGDIKTKPRRYF